MARKKIILTIGAFVIFFLFSFVFLLGKSPVKPPREFGATFSAMYAERFGFDWQKAYLAVLDDLGVKKIRLPAYWSEIEKNQGNFDCSRLDWQVEKATERNVEVILALGRKLPRWPECHEPDWVKNQNPDLKNKKLLDYIEVVVNHYKNSPAIKIWQVENEPFLKFGECPDFSKEFLDREIALVRSLDPPPGGRPLMITDSGELSVWVPAARRSDIFGSTLYRVVWNQALGSFKYPLLPSFFRFKKSLTEIFVGPKPMVIIELQGESWARQMTYEIGVGEQYISMNPEIFRQVLAYASQSGFDTFYFWGVEWWYWLKEIEGKPEMWDIAKEAINSLDNDY